MKMKEIGAENSKLTLPRRLNGAELSHDDLPSVDFAVDALGVQRDEEGLIKITLYRNSKTFAFMRLDENSAKELARRILGVSQSPPVSGV